VIDGVQLVYASLCPKKLVYASSSFGFCPKLSIGLKNNLGLVHPSKKIKKEIST
jgi:hypothetical protein